MFDGEETSIFGPRPASAAKEEEISQDDDP